MTFRTYLPREISMPSPVERAVHFVREQWSCAPRVGIILGTGQGDAIAPMQVQCSIPFHRIPHFPRSTALSHQGRLVCGHMTGIPTVVMQGRCHRYEGYSYDTITLPVQMMSGLGIQLLIVTNASGGLNPQFESGQIMVIADHIDLMFCRSRAFEGRRNRSEATAIAGGGRSCESQIGRSGAPRSPRIQQCYDADLIRQAQRIARREGFVAAPGVYVALSGPNYETRAEYRFLRRIGGDAVGMSTIPEVITAAQLGLRILALSTVTNVAKPDSPQTVDPQEVVDLAAGAVPNLSKIIAGIVATEA